jgi:hypothetical protein
MDAGAAEFGARAMNDLEGPINTYIEALRESFGNSFAAMADAIESTADTIDTSGLEAARDGIVDAISEQMQEQQEAARARFEASKTATPLFDGEGMGGAGRSNTGIIAQSLQKVGGGAAFARFSDAANPAAQQLREAQKQTGLLEKIANTITPNSMELMSA